MKNGMIGIVGLALFALAGVAQAQIVTLMATAPPSGDIFEPPTYSTESVVLAAGDSATIISHYARMKSVSMFALLLSACAPIQSLTAQPPVVTATGPREVGLSAKERRILEKESQRAAWRELRSDCSGLVAERADTLEFSNGDAMRMFHVSALRRLYERAKKLNSREAMISIHTELEHFGVKLLKLEADQILIGFNSSQFGKMDFQSGHFEFSGQE